MIVPFAQYPLFYKVPLGISLIKIIGLVAFARSLLYTPRTAYSSLLRLPQQKLVIVFFAYSVLWLVVEGRPFPHADVQRILSFILAFFIFSRMVDSEKKVKVILFLTLGGMILGTYRGFKEVFLLGYGRPQSVFGDPNYFALALLPAIMIAFWGFFFQKNKYVKALFAGAFMVLLLQLFLTASRGGILGLVPCVIALIWLSRQKTRIVLLLLLIGLLTIPFIPDNIYTRFHGSHSAIEAEDLKGLSGSQVSTKARFELLKSGVAMIKDKPIFGVGISNFKGVSQQYNPNVRSPQIAHCTWVEVLAEMGILGGFLVLLINLLTIRDLYFIVKWSREQDNREFEFISLALLTGFTGYLAAMTFLNALWEKYFWFFIFTAMTFRNLYDEIKAKERSLDAE